MRGRKESTDLRGVFVKSPQLADTIHLEIPSRNSSIKHLKGIPSSYQLKRTIGEDSLSILVPLDTQLWLTREAASALRSRFVSIRMKCSIPESERLFLRNSNTLQRIEELRGFITVEDFSFR